MAIHPSAIIDPKAELDSTVEVGPYVVIEGAVRIGANTRIRAHAYVGGWTEIGQACDIHPLAVVGHFPQDFHYHGDRTYCKIGRGVVVREGATIHRGTQPESATIVGDECFLLAYSHVGHNCQLGRGVKVYNMAAVSGHVEIGDQAIISGYALIHQFVRIGKLAFIAGAARVTMDVPPFFLCHGESTIVQHNVVGMQRAGYQQEAIHELRQAYRTLYRTGLPFRKAAAQLAETVRTDAGRELVAFIQTESRRGYCSGRSSPRSRDRHFGAEDPEPA